MKYSHLLDHYSELILTPFHSQVRQMKKKTIMSPSTQPQPPFMRIPLILRQAIYEQVLLSPTPIEIHSAARRDSVTSRSAGRSPSKKPRSSSLLQVCTQIRHEAALIYYSQNTFVIPWGFPNLGCRWLEALQRENRWALRNVCFCYGDGAFWTVYDARTALSALRMALGRSLVLKDLEEMKLWVPVCEFSVHTWGDLDQREDALWVCEQEVVPFSKGIGKA